MVKTSRKIRVFVGLLAIVVVTYAYCHVWERELPGTYTGIYPYGTETIEIKPNGIFIQKLPNVPGLMVTQVQGRWRYDPGVFQDNIILDNAINLDNGFGSVGSDFTPGQSILAVERSWGQVIFVLNADVGLELRRN